MTDQDKIQQLHIFIVRDKFSKIAWEERGLNIRSLSVCDKLSSIFNRIGHELIEILKEGSATNAVFSIALKKGISTIFKDDYDTEEREFICDLFYELSQI